jgi:hypothetical protein
MVYGEHGDEGGEYYEEEEYGDEVGGDVEGVQNMEKGTMMMGMGAGEMGMAGWGIWAPWDMCEEYGDGEGENEDVGGDDKGNREMGAKGMKNMGRCCLDSSCFFEYLLIT